MKTFSLLLLATFTVSANAAVMKVITRATNPSVQKIYSDLAVEFNKPRNCLDLTLVKVVKWSEANGRTPEDVRQAMIRESFHRFVTQWFDDGVDSTPFLSDREIESNAADFGSDLDAVMVKDLEAALKDKSLRVYGGGAGGNNTSGTVFSVYDLKNDEILNLTTSNFASDDDCGD